MHDMQNKTIILMCGLPGSGKTTQAKKLESEGFAIRLCPDDWIMGILENPDNVPERDRLRDPVEQLLWRHAQKLVQAGNSIIMENGFWSKTERESYRERIQAMGAKAELHVLTAPFEVLWERVEKRNIESTEFTMTKKELEDAYNSFEVPTAEEMAKYDFATVYNL
jgi:predicted kinase